VPPMAIICEYGISDNVFSEPLGGTKLSPLYPAPKLDGSRLT